MNYDLALRVANTLLLWRECVGASVRPSFGDDKEVVVSCGNANIDAVYTFLHEAGFTLSPNDRTGIIEVRD